MRLMCIKQSLYGGMFCPHFLPLAVLNSANNFCASQALGLKLHLESGSAVSYFPEQLRVQVQSRQAKLNNLFVDDGPDHHWQLTLYQAFQTHIGLQQTADGEGIWSSLSVSKASWSGLRLCRAVSS